jgi:hypothetical protein
MGNKRGLLLLAVPFFLLLSACVFDHESPGPLLDEPVRIGLGEAERANVELNMGAGEMKVRGGAEKLMEGHFEYKGDRNKPIVTSDTSGTHATVTIRQPEHVGMSGRQRYLWDLELNNKVLLDLALHCGAGHARLDLGDLTLRNLEVHMGAGQVDLDLRGTPTHDYEVDISGGVGQATIHLPEQAVGIRAEAHGGIGSISVTGLEKVGDHWENNLFDNAKVNVRLKVNGGIGEIRIIG